jgi:hypothetical protein
MPVEALQSERLSFEEACADRAFVDVVRWIGEFLCAPHADLGREGDVCPFARVALARQSIGFFRNVLEEAAGFEADIRTHMQQLEQDGREDIYRCRIVVPTRIAEADRAVQEVQRRLKPQFVARHLMVGQFYRDCDEPGLWNRAFRPLRTPVPLIAIRNMVPTDVAFLYHDASYLKTYLDKFGKRGSIALRQFETMREAGK